MAPIPSAAPEFIQLDKDYFIRSDGTTTPGFRDWRGSLESTGLFALNNNWVWGWDAALLSDRTFLQDYNPRLSRYYANATEPVLNATGLNDAAVSQLFLSGKGNRSYFDVRTIYYLGFSEADTQTQIPVIHPVLDYNYVFDRPILGGELGYKINFTSLTRSEADFRSDHSERAKQRHLYANSQSGNQDNSQLLVARHTWYLQPFLG